MVLLTVFAGLLMAACGSSTVANPPNLTEEGQVSAAGQAQESYEIITLLPPDAIPSIDNPRFYDVARADLEYAADETVIGLEVEGEARAYSTALLSSHEIVNDEIKGRPIAVTW